MPPANVSEAEPLVHTIGKRFRRNKKNIVSLGFSVSFGISESDVTHGIFRKPALEFPRVISPMGFSVSLEISENNVTHGIFHTMGFPESFGSRAPLLLKAKTKKNVKTHC